MVTEATTAQPVDIGIIVALPEELRELLARRALHPHRADDRTLTSSPAATTAAQSPSSARWARRRRQCSPSGSSPCSTRASSSPSVSRAACTTICSRATSTCPRRPRNTSQDAKAAPTGDGGFAIVPGAPAYRADFALLKAVRGFEFDHSAGHTRMECRVRSRPRAVLLPDAQSERVSSPTRSSAQEPKLLADGHVATGPVVGAAPGSPPGSGPRSQREVARDGVCRRPARRADAEPAQAGARHPRDSSDKGDARQEESWTISRTGVLRKYAMRNAVRLLLALLDAEALPPEPSLSRSSIESPTTGSSTAQASIARLPATGRDLFGREEELAWLDACWDEGVHVASIVAFGGVGKSALVNAWLRADGRRRVARGGAGVRVVVLQPGDRPAGVVGRVHRRGAEVVRGPGPDAGVAVGQGGAAGGAGEEAADPPGAGRRGAAAMGAGGARRASSRIRRCRRW